MKGRMYLAIMLLGLIAGCGEDDPKKVDVPFMRLWENQVLQSELLGRSVEYAVLLTGRLR
jgi:hypothetical protein